MDKSLNLRPQVPYLSARAKACLIWELLPSKNNIPGYSVPLPTPRRHRAAWPPSCRRWHLPWAGQESAFWGRGGGGGVQWPNESPRRTLGKKRMDECPPWLPPHSILGPCPSCWAMGTGVWPALPSSSSCISIFKMILEMALSHGTAVNQMLKCKRHSKLVSGVTVRDCDLPILSRGMPPCSDPGQELSGWSLAAPDQTLWRPQEPSFSW